MLTSSHANNIDNVHVNGPKALFKACTLTNVQRIIHISALGIDDEKNTAYALTKKAAEEYLQKLENIDWVILQPSLVYASGCYGGTSLFRALLQHYRILFL
ncbi:NAD(P)H-binding protein [Rickettsia rhipicephali]|uniref:NAD(P)H-binding protein n=1 Tax=Rickettsia rhipicephali TaxID=33992 RepID=UPI0022591320|nr:NAD(P)H-binding protein [Rickettsia rhipicephali]MCX4080237.1 NAD(P)H-binding protein [Rickettsia rhipicephali]